MVEQVGLFLFLAQVLATAVAAQEVAVEVHLERRLMVAELQQFLVQQILAVVVVRLTLQPLQEQVVLEVLVL
jgi:hypothetical protein